MIECFQADNRSTRVCLAQAAQLKRVKSYVRKHQLERDRMLRNAVEDLNAGVRDVPKFLDGAAMAFQMHDLNDS